MALYEITIVIILVLLIGYVLFVLIRNSRLNNESIVSGIDGEVYNVHNLHPDQNAAADTIAKVNKRIVKLFRHLKKELEEDRIDDEYKPKIYRLIKRYDPTNIRENSSFNSGTSYTENKGEIIALCLRHKKMHKIHDMNTIIFVVIHELGHVMSEGYGHTVTFWQNFKYILQHAVDIGIYDPINYANSPMTYCGMVVNYNPLYDDTL